MFHKPEFYMGARKEKHVRESCHYVGTQEKLPQVSLHANEIASLVTDRKHD